MEASRVLVSKASGRRLTVSEIFALAQSIERLYAASGYILVRVGIPPQTLVDGGTLRLQVVDGRIGQIRAESVPTEQRGVVLRRVGDLQGRGQMRIEAIERGLLLAGEVPGLSLRSALAPGVEVGETDLVLEAQHDPATLLLSLSNDLPASIGHWQQGLWASLNSPLGFGEQVYLSAVTSIEEGPFPLIGDDFRSFGLGALVPLGRDGLNVNPEYSYSRITYPAIAGAPATQSMFSRLALRAEYPIVKTRARQWVIGASLEHLQQEERAVGFAVPTSRDDYRVIRAFARHDRQLPQGRFSFSVTQSAGISGREAVGAVPVSRLGAAADFVKLAADLQLSKSLHHDYSFALFGAAQTSFGEPLFKSEQFALDGPQGLAGFAPGTLSVDSGVTARLEVAKSTPIGGFDLEPFVAVAGGLGKLASPTAVEVGEVWAASTSFGIRMARQEGVAVGLSAKIEVGFGQSNASVGSRVNLLCAAEIQF